VSVYVQRQQWVPHGGKDPHLGDGDFNVYGEGFSSDEKVRRRRRRGPQLENQGGPAAGQGGDGNAVSLKAFMGAWGVSI